MSKQIINYQVLFDHVSRLPILALTVNFRGGSDFFESLLDGHEEILDFRGSWDFHSFWESSIFKDKDLGLLIDEFTLCHKHIPMFKGEFLEMERWDQLGENRDESFSYNVSEFRQHLYNILSPKVVSKENFFYAIHIAYALVIGQNIYKTRLIFYHIHFATALERFRLDFPSVKVLHMTRHPLNGFSSRVDTYPSEFDGKKESKGTLFTFQSLFNFVLQYDLCADQCDVMKGCRVITLESLHANPEYIMRSFCAEYGLTFSPSLLVSTVHGKQWWGDTRTKSGNGYLRGFRSNAAEPRWYGKFFWWEVLIFETILWRKMNAYEYRKTFNITQSNQFIFKIVAFFLIMLPMKYEIILMYRMLSFAKGFQIKTFHFTFGLFKYVQRVLLFYKVLKQSSKEVIIGNIYPSNRDEMFKST